MGCHHHLFTKGKYIMNDIACPYKLSGLCYRKGCIHIPELDCMKKAEYDSIMKSARKYLKKKKKHVKGGKKYEY